MSRIAEFVESLKPDRLVPSVSVFPAIDGDKLATDLHASKQGRERGSANLPASDDESLDSVESQIITEVNRLRVMGLSRFDEHMETYARRLRDASSSKAELRTLAETAVTDYQTSVAIHHGGLANHRQRIMERHLERKWFIEDNRLRRTSYDPGNMWLSVGLAAILILGESGMNGYFFATSNTLGLLGGTTVALVISLVNVGFSMGAGYLARNLNHVRWLRKTAGALAVVGFLGGSITFNVAVAHFRDAAGSMPWEQAVTHAIQTFRADPTALGSFESWLLLCVGMLVCLAAFWKGYRLDDPYPDYSRVHERWEKARDDYAEDVEAARRDLEARRDEAIDELEDARKTLTSNINEAIDIVYAKAGLTGQLQAFLDQAQLVSDYLLALYREANRSTRTTPPPSHFNHSYAFKYVPGPAIESLPQRDAAQAEIVAVNTIVDDTISKIFERYAEAIASYESIEDIERSANTLPAYAATPTVGAATPS